MSDSKTQPLRLRLITVIWGASFAGMFCSVGLRSLLAAGNLPALVGRRVVWTVFTTPEDAALIEASPEFERVRASVRVEFSLFSTREIDSAHYGSHNILWQRGVELALRNREIVFFLIPDLLYARGTLAGWISAFDAGAGALYTPGPQVVLETILPEIESLAPGPNGEIDIDPAMITKLLLRHLHPLHIGNFSDAPRRVGFAEHDVRLVPGAGLAFRPLTSQPFCFDPGRFHRMRNFSPEDHADAIVVAPCTTLSVEPLGKRVEWYYRPWRMDRVRTLQLGAWWQHFGPLGCRRDSEVAHFFTVAGDAESRAKFARAETAGQRFVARVTAAWRWSSFIEALQSQGLVGAAKFLAAAGQILGPWRLPLPVAGASVLVPSAAAFQFNAAELWSLLAPGREQELLELLRHHVVPPIVPGAAPATLSGRPIPDDVTLEGPEAVVLENVYVLQIDRVLGIARPVAPSAPTPLPSPATVVSGDRWTSGWGYSAWAKKSAWNLWRYRLARVPLLELLVSPITPRRFAVWILSAVGSFKELLRNLGRRTAPWIERLPFGQRFVALTKRFLAARAADGSIGAVHLAILKIPALGGLMRALFSLRARINAALAYRRIHGSRALLRRVWILVRGRLPLRTGLRTGPTDERFDAWRKANALRMIARILGDYAERQPLDVGGYPPAALLRSHLVRLGLADAAATERLFGVLDQLAAKDPDWSEVWLERAYLHQDAGARAAAAAAFGRAASGVAKTQGPGLEPQARAAAELAKLAFAEGDDPSGIAWARRALAAGGNQNWLHAKLGMALRRTGKFEAAAEHFLQGARFDEPIWPLPSLGRDLSRIDLPTLPQTSNHRHRNSA